MAITSSSCQWNEVFTTKHQPARIADIQFKRPKLHVAPQPANDTSPILATNSKWQQPFSQDQKMFFKGLKAMMLKSAILTQLQPLVPAPPPLTPAVKKLPDLIMNLLQPRYSTISKDELEIECDRIFREGLKITQGEADYLEKCTKLQTQSVLWFSHQKGRITASKFSAVCHTSISSPSQSFVEGILKEQNSARRGIPALGWGLEKEPCAREEYRQKMKKTHVNFKVEQAGLFVHPLYPHLGASPDGLISCTCCGKGVIEIKCPYSIQDSDPAAAVDTANFYLEHSEGGIKLSTTHAYYYQIQGQLAICDRPYCDFVCWTTCGMHLERITRDPMVWDEIQPKLDLFYMKVILPQILCPNTTSIVDETSSSKLNSCTAFAAMWKRDL
ncbi:hypothetical protein EMCRGX_G020270 [Ephydatia muelleri]